jgi:hypothetical protein
LRGGASTVSFRVVGGKLDLLADRIACRLRDGDRLLTCAVSRQILRDLGAYHQLWMSDEAVFSRLLSEIERLVNERVRAGRLDDDGNVTLGTADLLRYGPGLLRADAAE